MKAIDQRINEGVSHLVYERKSQKLDGLSGGIVTPAIAAISLGLAGRGAMSARTGRNCAFDAAGNAVTAGVMGAAGQYISKTAIFFGAAALCIAIDATIERMFEGSPWEFEDPKQIPLLVQALGPAFAVQGPHCLVARRPQSCAAHQ